MSANAAAFEFNLPRRAFWTTTALGTAIFLTVAPPRAAAQEAISGTVTTDQSTAQPSFDVDGAVTLDAGGATLSLDSDTGNPGQGAFDIGAGETATLSDGAIDFSDDDVTVNATGTLTVDADATATTTGLLTVNGDAGFGGDVTADAVTGSGAIALDAATLTLDGASSIGFTGTLSGTGGLTRAGSGLTNLNAAQTYTGTTEVTGGTLLLGLSGSLASTDLQIGAAGAFVAVSSGMAAGTDVVNEGTFEISADTDIASVNGGGDIVLNAASTLTLTSGVSDLTDAGVSITGDGGLTVDGGTVTVGTTNTFTGDATFLSGQLTYSLGDQLGNGTLVLGGTSTSDVVIANGTFGQNNAIRVSGTDTRYEVTNGNTVTLGSLALAFEDSAGLVVGGLTGQSGSVFLAPQAAATVGTDVAVRVTDGASLTLGNGNAAAAFATIDTIVEGSLDLAGQNTTVGTLGGVGGTVTNSGAAALLTVSGDSDFSGTIEDGANQVSVTLNGTGTNAFRGTNTYTGTTTVNGGTLDVFGGSALADSTEVSLVGGTLRVSQAETIGALSGTGFAQLAEDLTVSAASGSTTFSGDLSLTGDFIKTGAGEQVLAGTNSAHRGDIVINAGTLGVENGDAIFDGGAVSFGGGTLALDDDEEVGGIFGLGAIDLGSNLLTFGGDDADRTFTGPITGSGGRLTKTGAGRTLLTGGTPSTYSGVTRIEEGILAINAETALGSGRLTLAGGTFEAAQTLSLDNAFSVTGLGGTIAAASGERLTMTGAGTIGSDLTFGTATRDGTVWMAGGTNYVYLSPVDVTVAFGTLQLGVSAGSAFLADANVTTVVDAGATLDIFGDDAVVNALTGSGLVTNSMGAASTLTLSGTSTFDGVIEDGTGISLVKDGAGTTTTLTGDSTFAGGSTVTAGTLILDGGTLGDIDVAGGGTLSLTDTATAAAVTNAGIGSNAGAIDALSNTGGTFGNSGAIAGAATVSGGDVGNSGTVGSVVLSGAGSFTNEAMGEVLGTTSIADSAVLVGNGGLFSGDVTVSGGTFRIDTDTTVDGDVSNSGTVAAGGSAAVTLTLANGGIFTEGGVLDGTVQELTIAADTIRLLGGSTQTGDVTLLGDVSNAGNQTLVNDLSGGLTVAAGGTTTVAADLNGGAFDVSVDEASAPDSAGSLTVGAGNAFTGIGTLTNAGEIGVEANATLEAEVIENLAAGEIALGADATLRGTGNTLNNAGAIVLADGGTLEDAGNINNLASGTITLSASGTINADTDNDGDVLTNAGAISSVDGGASAITLGDGSADTFNNLAGGSFAIGDTDQVTGSALTLQNAGTVDVGTDAGLSVEAFVNQSGGALNNAGTVTVTGAALVNAAGATLDNAAAGTVASDVQSAGSFTNAGAVTGTVTNTGDFDITDGTVAALVNDAGTTDLTGGEVTGTTTVEGGTVTNSGGTLTGLTTVNGGVLASAATTGDVSVGAAGAADVTGGSVGVLDNRGDTDISAGTVAQIVNLEGTIDLTGGEVTGTTLIENGTVTNSGGTLTGDVLVLDGVLVSDATTGNVSVDAIAEVDVTGGTLGQLSNSGDADISGGAVASLSNDGGTTDLTGGTVTGATAITGGIVTNSGGTLAGATTVTDGLLVTSATTGDVTVGAAGEADVTGGSVAALGNAGDTDISGGTVASLFNSAGTTDLSGGAVTGATAISGGTVTNSGGTLTGLTTVTDGVLATSATTGDVTVGAAGEVDVTGGSVAALRNAGDADIASGTVASLVNSAGTTDLAGGAVTGATTVTGGTVTNTGGLLSSATVTAGGTLVNLADIGTDVVSDGTFTNSGTVSGAVTSSGISDLGGNIDGRVTNAATGVMDLAANVDDDLENAAGAALTVDGPSAVSGTLQNDGSLLVLNGLDFGLLSNDAAGTVESDGTDVLADAALRVQSGGTLSGGGIANTGSMGLFSGSSVVAPLSNSGLLIANGSTSITGDFSSAVGSVLDMQDGDTGDALSVTGNTTLDGVVYLDADLSEGGSTGDLISTTGNLDGSPLLRLNNTGDGFGELGDPIALLSYGGTSSLSPTLDVEELPLSSGVIYQLSDTGSTWEVDSVLNPGIGGLTGGLALTQSLIGSVINRPSSPFVTGGAATEEEPCGYGGWGRVTGGQATASGDTTTAAGTTESEIEANYYGIQAGFDYSCFNGYYNGWNLSFGGILGVNRGNTEQPVFATDGTGQIDTSIVSSVNETDFTQTYAGVYVGANRDRFFADLQLRFENTEFDLENKVRDGGSPLGVSKQSYDSNGYTFSGSAGYAFPLNEAQSLSLIPSLGFAISRTEVDDLEFDDGGRLEIDDIESRVGFASMTLNQSRVAEGGTQAISYFGTATVYHDFADEAESTFFPGSTSTETSFDASSSNLETYGEVSIGLNYTKLLDEGQAIPGKRLDASVRADSRFSDNLDGWGLTAQMRLQF